MFIVFFTNIVGTPIYEIELLGMGKLMTGFYCGYSFRDRPGRAPLRESRGRAAAGRAPLSHSPLDSCPPFC
jgi:hypothetical protein